MYKLVVLTLAVAAAQAGVVSYAGIPAAGIPAINAAAINPYNLGLPAAVNAYGINPYAINAAPLTAAINAAPLTTAAYAAAAPIAAPVAAPIAAPAVAASKYALPPVRVVEEQPEVRQVLEAVEQHGYSVKY